MESNAAAKQRQSNMELLRILAMMGVIALHYNGLGEYGGFALTQNSFNLTLLEINECFWAWPVNAFIMLSGYFLYKRKKADNGIMYIYKPVKLFAQLVVFQMLAYALEVFGGQREFKIMALLFCIVPDNYFVVLYITLYLFSPFVNRLFNSLDKRSKLLLGAMMFAVFSLWAYSVDLLEILLDRSLGQSSPVAYGGDTNGYTVVNFLLCYLIGALLGSGDFSIRRPVAVFAGTTAVNCLLGQMIGIYPAVAYSNPLVIVQAASLLSAFEKLNIAHSSVINRLAGASFTVYLAHTFFIKLCHVEKFVNLHPLVMLAHIALCQIGIYMACFVIYLIYDAVTKPVFNRLRKRVNAFEIRAESIST